jgi:hypothetical protein
MTELTKGLKKSIKEVLWDYHWNIKHSNSKKIFTWITFQNNSPI